MNTRMEIRGQLTTILDENRLDPAAVRHIRTAIENIDGWDLISAQRNIFHALIHADKYPAVTRLLAAHNTIESLFVRV